MRHIAIVGSGPAGYYTAEACVKILGRDVRVDILDRLPVPFGLIRSGVAPDHQAIKSVARQYETVALTDNVRFVGHVAVGADISVAELQGLYDAVIFATGAPADKRLGIDGDDLPGVTGSAAFVGWYNGHPDFVSLAPALDGGTAVIVGNGNVALDVARILAKTPAELAGSDIAGHALAALSAAHLDRIVILGRRGPQQAAMTFKELSELADLARAAPQVDAADLPPPEQDAALDAGTRKTLGLLRHFAAAPAGKPIKIEFDFYAQPVAIEGDGRVERIIVERTRLDADGHAVRTGAHYAIDTALVLSCIGYRTPPIAGLPYDEALGRFASEDGRIAQGLYCVGWARRGPTGTIGANRPDGYRIVEKILADRGAGSEKAGSSKEGRAGLDRMLEARGVDIVTFRDWQKIDSAEIDHARSGAPREKFVAVADMMAAATPGAGG
jgi:NADPH-dependent glutamate synthase beta subunit-like oxidoreductase